eukprot:TRINITY_DN3325_c1_g1_i2.p1 TRINITY_DN3325_c1_g1~~TRINITY_DN3325_c1_g1_i2.p1  ORF type:complete len:306 (-),score=88.90 TRINITY_DN3325_c1_g1_i2:289-1206(-)
MFDSRSTIARFFPEAPLAPRISAAFGDHYLMNNKLEEAEESDPDNKILSSNKSKGYQVCGTRNRSGKPCQRIGICPFHHTKTPLIVPTHRDLFYQSEKPPNNSLNQSLPENLPVFHLTDSPVVSPPEMVQNNRFMVQDLLLPSAEANAAAIELLASQPPKLKKKRISAVTSKGGGYLSWSSSQSVENSFKRQKFEAENQFVSHPHYHHPIPYSNVVHHSTSTSTSSTTYTQIPNIEPSLGLIPNPIQTPHNFQPEWNSPEGIYWDPLAFSSPPPIQTRENNEWAEFLAENQERSNLDDANRGFFP